MNIKLSNAHCKRFQKVKSDIKNKNNDSSNRKNLKATDIKVYNVHNSDILKYFFADYWSLL